MDDHTADDEAVLVAAASAEASRALRLPAVALLGTAAELVIRDGWCTYDSLRARLGVNERTAEYLLHQLEAWGIIGPHRGNRPRVVYYGTDRLRWVLECIAQYGGVVPDRNPLLGTAESGLTDNHVAVIKLAAEGLTNNAIAKQLHVSEDTVKKWLKEGCRILGAYGRANLVHRAHEENVLDHPADQAGGQLTEDERRVLRGTANGQTNAEVAAELDRKSPGEWTTDKVKKLVPCIRRVLGAKDPANSVHLGWRKGELRQDDATEETPT